MRKYKKSYKYIIYFFIAKNSKSAQQCFTFKHVLRAIKDFERRHPKFFKIVIKDINNP